MRLRVRPARPAQPLAQQPFARQPADRIAAPQISCCSQSVQLHEPWKRAAAALLLPFACLLASPAIAPPFFSGPLPSQSLAT